MFYNCEHLEKIININTINISIVGNMNSMFYGCQNLVSINLTNFNASSVVNMSSMFCNCNKLGILDLSDFTTSKIENMNSMFKECHSLISLFNSLLEHLSVSYNMVFIMHISFTIIV